MASSSHYVYTRHSTTLGEFISYIKSTYFDSLSITIWLILNSVFMLLLRKRVLIELTRDTNDHAIQYYTQYNTWITYKIDVCLIMTMGSILIMIFRNYIVKHAFYHKFNDAVAKKWVDTYIVEYQLQCELHFNKESVFYKQLPSCERWSAYATCGNPIKCIYLLYSIYVCYFTAVYLRFECDYGKYLRQFQSQFTIIIISISVGLELIISLFAVMFISHCIVQLLGRIYETLFESPARTLYNIVANTELHYYTAVHIQDVEANTYTNNTDNDD